jgi:acyl-CoA synthetase (AMP-forming)/AMP-acid ligase II
VEASVLRADPSLRRAAAFSVPGDGTERLAIVAEAAAREIAPGDDVRLEEAVRCCVTAEFGVGPDVVIRPRGAVPTTTSGKVRRQEAKQIFLADAARRAPV